MIQGFNPRTGEPAGQPVAETTDADVDAAAEAAAAALTSWTRLGDEGRARALAAVADALDARAGELVALADEETALGETRLTGEVARTTGQLRLFAGVLRDGSYADPVASPAAGGIAEIRRVNHPVGPVAVFAASNFPFAFSVAGGDTAAALAAGCPVVVKAHEGHPQTSAATARIVAEALAGPGARPGCSAWCTGSRPVSGCSPIRRSPRPGSPAPPAAGWSWPGSAPSATRRSRSTASSARSTRSSCCPARPPAAPRRSHPGTRAR